MMHILADLLLLIAIGVLVKSHHDNRDILKRIEKRDAEGRALAAQERAAERAAALQRDRELLERADVLQRRTDAMAEKVRQEAQERHTKTVEAALQAREAAKEAANAVHRLADVQDARPSKPVEDGERTP